MAVEFTQEQKDRIEEIVKERIERVEKKYSDYEDLKKKASDYDKVMSNDYEGKIKSLEEKLSIANEKAMGHDKIVSDLTTRAEKAEGNSLRMKIANEFKIPLELADKLSGNNEDEVRKDAETLSKFIGTAPTPAPLKNNDSVQTDSTMAAYKSMMTGLMQN